MTRLPLQPCACAPPRVRIVDGLAEPFDEGLDCPQCFIAATRPTENRLWGGDGRVVPVRGKKVRRAAPPRPASGPGTELKALLASFGVTEATGCGCSDRAVEMDRHGPAWCRANRATIAGWLRESAAKRTWAERLAAGARAVASGFVPHPLDVYGSLVDEAVRRHEARAAGGPAFLFTGGIGDVIAVEGLLTPEEREAVATVYYACPAAHEVQQLIRALPNYPRLRAHVVLPTGGRTLYSQAAVEEAVGSQLPPGVRDLSIATVFPQRLPYRGSSILTYPLARPELPPAPYAVVCPVSTWYAPPGRNFDADDWRTCLAALDRHALTGVVLCRERTPIPDHPRLIDLQGRLSILESVEVIKGAAGYLGIDTWASVPATKLFPASRISVKCRPGAHARDWLATYYAPRAEFGFVTPRLEVPPWI